MKITGIEKFAIGIIAVCLIGLILMIPSCVKAKKQIEDNGFKSIVNEFWEGKGVTNK